MSAVRRLLGAVTAAGLAIIVAIALPGPASAHTVLTGSDPAADSTLLTAPTVVTLTFDGPVENYEPVLVVTGPDGSVFSTGAPVVSGNTVRTDLVGAGPAGAYRIVYRIVSADGHPVSAELTYTLSAAAAGPAHGSPAPPDAAAAGSAGPVGSAGSAGSAGPAGSADGSGSVDRSSSGSSSWLWIGVGVAAMLLITAVVVILRRPDTSDD